MIIHESLETKVTRECGVLVAGGGFAGIAAALAAARCGADVTLLERGYVLGGLGTAGLVTIYLPLCDGYGRQVSFGIAEELLRLSVSRGFARRYPDNWLDGAGVRTERDKRFQVEFNPQTFICLAEKALTDAGVTILYGAQAVGAATDGKRISAVIVESRDGRQAIAAKEFVDCTGDAFLAHYAGVTCKNGGENNLLAGWYYYLEGGDLKLKMLGASDVEKGTELVKRRFDGLRDDDVNEFMRLSHGKILEDVAARGFEPTSVASIPQLRMTRRIAGEYEQDAADEHKEFSDSVGMVGNWKKRGPVYEVPLRSLYSAECENLTVAGRITACTEAMWDVMRVIPCCAVTGQAAGTAAALGTRDVAKIQARLKNDGVVLHEKDL